MNNTSVTFLLITNSFIHNFKNVFFGCIVILSPPGSSEGQQTAPQVEITPPENQPEDNGEMEEQTDGEEPHNLSVNANSVRS